MFPDTWGTEGVTPKHALLVGQRKKNDKSIPAREGPERERGARGREREREREHEGVRLFSLWGISHSQTLLGFRVLECNMAHPPEHLLFAMLVLEESSIE